MVHCESDRGLCRLAVVVPPGQTLEFRWALDGIDSDRQPGVLISV